MYEQRWPWTSRWPSVCVTLLARTSQHPSLVCRHMVELLGPGISMSQGLFLHQSTQTHKKLIYLRLAGSEFTISVFKRRKTISTTTGPKAPDDGQEDARNMLSCTWTTSNKYERLMHLVGWFIWMLCILFSFVLFRVVTPFRLAVGYQRLKSNALYVYSGAALKFIS